MDDGRLLGARLDRGVQIRPPDYEKFSRVERVVIAVPYYKERAYWDFLKAQIGEPLRQAGHCCICCQSRLGRPGCLVLRRAGCGRARTAEVVRKLAPCVNRLDVCDLYLVVSAIAPVRADPL
jgi:hypothetical protein